MENRAYYAVIPANVRYCKELSANMKLMYGEITALSNEKGYCWASNSYFAELYDVDKRSVSRWIAKLEKLGFIRTELVYSGTKQVKERRIYIGGIRFVDVPIENADIPMGINNQSVAADENPDANTQKEHSPMDENVDTYGQKCQDPIDKNVYTPIDKNVQENNKDFNNINNNIVHPKDALQPQAEKKDSLDEFFEKVWAMYPNKKGKDRIKRKRKEALSKLGLEHIGRIIERYKAYVEEQRSRGFDLQYQNGSTFFGGGYLDYVDELSEPPRREEVLSDESRRLLEAILK